MNEPSSTESDIFDLSLLPATQLQFVVISDTHYLLPDNAQETEWASLAEFPERTERALRMASSLPSDFLVHLGDVCHDYPETGRAQISRKAAIDQFQRLGLQFYQAAGNMDIGDKPDPTCPANWVDDDTLAEWHATFGPSWHSFDHGPVHGIVLNTQIMNGPLPAAEEQRDWFENDLMEHSGRRLLLFLHMPIFFADRNEHSLGFYNSLDEPARSWLLSLIELYGIEQVFAGHTHFVALNRRGRTRMWVAPSTATSRAGLAEAFTVQPDDQGRSDIDKLGLYLVRVDDRGSSVNLIRSGHDTPAHDPTDSRKMVVARVSRDLPHGTLGVFASHPLGHSTPGPVIWPSIVRQPVRDDWRPLACLEMGARSVRVPASDLEDSNELERLQTIRDEGVAINPYWLWHNQLDLVDAVDKHREMIDGIEIVLPGATIPSWILMDALQRLSRSGLPIGLAPALRSFERQGQYHARTRVGYRRDELLELDRQLRSRHFGIDRVAFRLYSDEDICQVIQDIAHLPIASIGGVDVYLDLSSEDDRVNANRVAEAVLATRAAGSRLVLGPLMDLDRSMDVTHGLLNRLSNPRPPFHVARLLNSILNSEPAGFNTFSTVHRNGVRHVAARRADQEFHLLLDDSGTASIELDVSSMELNSGRTATVYDLAAGLSEEIDQASSADDRPDLLRQAISRGTGPWLIATS